VVKIDEKFVSDSWKTKINVAGREVEVRAPSYIDYFVLKVMSARASDARDIATLVWKKGLPKGLMERSNEIVPYLEVFKEKLKKSILPTIKDKRFLHSWRGTFVDADFNEKHKEQVIEQLSSLLMH